VRACVRAYMFTYIHAYTVGICTYARTYECIYNLYIRARVRAYHGETQYVPDANKTL